MAFAPGKLDLVHLIKFDVIRHLSLAPYKLSIRMELLELLEHSLHSNPYETIAMFLRL